MNQLPTSNPAPQPEDESPVQPENKQPNRLPKTWREIWGRLLLLGLGETTLRIITGALAIVFVLVVVWVMGKYFLKSAPASAQALVNTPTLETTLLPIAATAEQNAQTASLQSSFGIARLPLLHTNIPSKPRASIITYTIKAGDTLSSIAQNYGLKAESLVSSNVATLLSHPDYLDPGLAIDIPPEDGAVYIWNTGDGLNGVAKYYGVNPDDIVNWPSNNLNEATLGDYALPNIPAGAKLFIPGGVVETFDWLPRITRDSPAVSSVFGPGSCGKITTGNTGTGVYVWPTTLHYLSGYDYTAIHHGIDIAGQLGNPVYAVDYGVVVYAGVNNFGYGNLIIVDHGGKNDWQSVYAHLSEIDVSCGESVDQSQTIGLVGATGNASGPHLHFELRENGSTVNPWDFLPK
jgi:murein DD-endopeptidase MepM/ murein hydrolase activator NlpD